VHHELLDRNRFVSPLRVNLPLVRRLGGVIGAEAALGDDEPPDRVGVTSIPPAHERRRTMATRLDVTDDLVYDLVSIQYHALQAIESYRSYLNDAEGEDSGVTDFIERCLEQDLERARTCHELLGRLTEGT
jgi:hypothetical protein